MNRKGNVLVIILLIITILALVGAAYLYGQNQNLKTTVAYTSPSPSPSLQAVATPTPSVTTSKATVAFEADGSFSQAEKDELYSKVINPYLDYNQDQKSSLVSLTISKNDKPNKDVYPYLALGIFKNGGTEGWVVVRKGTGVDWWYLTCMGPCPLSDSFKTKYPEISANNQ